MKETVQETQAPLDDGGLHKIEARDPLEAILIGYPKRIEEGELTLMRLKRDEFRLKEKMDGIETEILGRISMEKTDEGKQKYSNEAARLHRLQESLRANHDYQKAKSDHWDMGAQALAAARVLNRWENELKDARALVMYRARLKVELIL